MELNTFTFYIEGIFLVSYTIYLNIPLHSIDLKIILLSNNLHIGKRSLLTGNLKYSDLLDWKLSLELT